MNRNFIVIGALFLIPSVLFFVFPRFFLTFGSKWKYKDATPTEASKTVGYIVASVGIAVGLLLILGGIFYDDIKSIFDAGL